MIKRVILVVLDSVGIGEMPDAALFKDEGSNTLGNIAKKFGGINMPNMEKIGIGNIASLQGIKRQDIAQGSFGKCAEASMGKDTVTGHLEISGVILKKPLNTFPNGFSKEIIDEFKVKIGRDILGNEVASGTEIIERLGKKHVDTGYPIIYTSADSVFQIAAHEDVIPIEEQYRICEIAREMLRGDRLVGRVIARPFTGEEGNYSRTSNRRDYAIDPPGKTILDYIKDASLNVQAVGKIEDIFNKRGVTQAIHTKNNMDGVDKTLEYMQLEKPGLIFTNLVDFDMLYGHRNNPQGYKNALEEFDKRLPEIIDLMNEDDVLMITADHGCDPTTPSTDHSREYIPVLIYGDKIKDNIDIGTRKCFCDIGKTILEMLNIENELLGEGFTKIILKEEV
ncbi:MAG: phosphopentomutase [Clostridiaceae bacterium]